MAEKLRSLLTFPDVSDGEILQNSFNNVMNILLNKALLRAGENRYRFCELELYFKDNTNHKDTFTHGTATQLEHCKWYFHTRGGVYRGGTYKGLDLALGDAFRHVGILIRSIQNMEDQALFCGPCLCVNEILRATENESIENFVSNFGIDVFENEKLKIISNENLVQRTIYKTPRVGLSLRTKNTVATKWWRRCYRWLSVSFLPKHRHLLVVSLRDQFSEITEKEIIKLTGTTRVSARKYLEAYEKGKASGDPRSLMVKN